MIITPFGLTYLEHLEGVHTWLNENRRRLHTADCTVHVPKPTCSCGVYRALTDLHAVINTMKAKGGFGIPALELEAAFGEWVKSLPADEMGLWLKEQIATGSEQLHQARYTYKKLMDQPALLIGAEDLQALLSAARDGFGEHDGQLDYEAIIKRLKGNNPRLETIIDPSEPMRPISDAAPIQSLSVDQEMESWPPKGTMFLSSALGVIEEFARLQRAAMKAFYGNDKERQKGRAYIQYWIKIHKLGEDDAVQ